MSEYELKKLSVEYKRVNAAREEQELRVYEMMEQIKKIEVSIEASKAKEDDLLARIAEMKNKQ